MRTMRDGGKSFEPDALRAAVNAVKGFPFMLQLVGYRVWRMAGDSRPSMFQLSTPQQASLVRNWIKGYTKRFGLS